MSKNKSEFNWTFCQLLTEKPNCTKIDLENAVRKCTKIARVKRPLLSETSLFIQERLELLMTWEFHFKISDGAMQCWETISKHQLNIDIGQNCLLSRQILLEFVYFRGCERSIGKGMLVTRSLFSGARSSLKGKDQYSWSPSTNS